MRASSISQAREGIANPYIAYDKAQSEQSDIEGAERDASLLEGNESQYASIWQAQYGLEATRQLHSDFASNNEAIQNEIAEWSRAVDEAITNLKAMESFQLGPYANAEIVTHYSAAAAAANSAEKYRKLEYADSDALITRLRNDLSKTRSQLSALQKEHPELATQPQNV